MPTVGLALLALVTITLTAVVGSGIGVLLGSALRATERVSGLSISLSFYLFVLAGGITDIAYLPRWLQAVSTYIPSTYSLDALRQTLLYGSSGGILLDLGVLALAAVIALLIGIPVMRRRIESLIDRVVYVLLLRFGDSYIDTHIESVTVENIARGCDLTHIASTNRFNPIFI